MKKEFYLYLLDNISNGYDAKDISSTITEATMASSIASFVSGVAKTPSVIMRNMAVDGDDSNLKSKLDQLTRAAVGNPVRTYKFKDSKRADGFIKNLKKMVKSSKIKKIDDFIHSITGSGNKVTVRIRTDAKGLADKTVIGIIDFAAFLHGAAKLKHK